jgi:hypothetical protein
MYMLIKSVIVINILCTCSAAARRADFCGASTARVRNGAQRQPVATKSAAPVRRATLLCRPLRCHRCCPSTGDAQTLRSCRAACVAVQATGTSVDGLSEKARIRLLRQLAEVATGSALPQSPPLSLPRPSVVSEAVGRFVQPWQARQTAEAAEALLQLGSELVRMVAALKTDRVSYTAGETSGADTLEMVAQQCQQLASYIGQPGDVVHLSISLYCLLTLSARICGCDAGGGAGMEDGKHTDYPRLIDLVFNLVSGALCAIVNGGVTGFSVALRPCASMCRCGRCPRWANTTLVWRRLCMLRRSI